MIKKTIKLMCVSLVLFLGGCAMNVYPGGPTPLGLLVTETKSTAASLAITIDKDAQPEKVGEATSGAVFGLFAFGDSSVTAAMKVSGITRIHHVDYVNQSFVFGLYMGTKTIVYGE